MSDVALKNNPIYLLSHYSVRCYRCISGYRLLFCLYYVFQLIQICVSLYSTMLLARLIAKVGTGEEGRELRGIIELGICYLLLLMISYMAFLVHETIEKGVRTRLKMETMETIVHRNDFSMDYDSAKLTEIIYSDLNNITSFLFFVADSSLILIQMIATMILICVMSLGLSSIFICANTLWFLYTVVRSMRLKAINLRLREETDAHFKMARDIIQNARFLEPMRSVCFHLGRYRKNMSELKAMLVLRDKKTRGIIIMNEAFQHMWTVIMLGFFLFYRFRGGLTTANEIIMYLSYARRFNGCVVSMSNRFTDIQQFSVSLERCFHIIHTERRRPDDAQGLYGKREGGIPLEHIDDKETAQNIPMIQIEELSFAYRNHMNNVISDLHCTLKSNRILVTGRNGAGKTTLLYLLAGLLESQKGSIRFLHPHANEEEVTDYQEDAAVLMQDMPLFDLSIRDNILSFHHSEEFTDADIMWHGRQVGLDTDIQLLPQGLDTLIGEIRDLSLGQRKKIQLVRTLMMPSSLLLLDEPLTGLDALSQKKVIDHIYRISNKKRVMIATHKPELFTGFEERISL